MDQVPICLDLMRQDPLFRWCSEDNLRSLAQHTIKRQYRAGDEIVRQGAPQTSVVLLADGIICREVHLLDGRLAHRVLDNTVFGTMNSIRASPAHATLRCETDCVVYELESWRISEHIKANASLAEEMLYGVTREALLADAALQTPLFQQDSTKPDYLATSVGAVIESFYRSAMMEFLNRRLGGSAPGPLFPNMRVQIPIRILYLNGFKTIRHFLDQHIDPRQYTGPGQEFAVRVAMACAPGAIMTPISSLLEACNAHQSHEPLSTRWMRGLAPRGLREIIFGIGLNQMSDFFEERMPQEIQSPTLRALAGGLSAGIVSGYLSHVPHNLATMKMLNPALTYKEHYKIMCEPWLQALSTKLPYRQETANVLGALMPRGVHIRSMQVTGTFCILNGILKLFAPNKPDTVIPN